MTILKYLKNARNRIFLKIQFSNHEIEKMPEIILVEFEGEF